MLVLLRGGEEVVRTRGPHLVYTHPTPGAYRIEVRVKDLVGGGETVQRAPIHLRAEAVTDAEQSVR